MPTPSTFVDGVAEQVGSGCESCGPRATRKILVIPVGILSDLAQACLFQLDQ